MRSDFRSSHSGHPARPDLSEASFAAHQSRDEHIYEYGSAGDDQLITVYPAPSSIPLLHHGIDHGLRLVAASPSNPKLRAA